MGRRFRDQCREMSSAKEEAAIRRENGDNRTWNELIRMVKKCDAIAAAAEAEEDAAFALYLAADDEETEAARLAEKERLHGVTSQQKEIAFAALLRVTAFKRGGK